MTTPTDLRARAKARRAALDCDNEVARVYDAAAEAIEEKERQLCAENAILLGLLDRCDVLQAWSRRWKARAKIGRADARTLDATAVAFDGYVEDLRGAAAVVDAALAWRAAVQACDGWHEAEEALLAALDEWEREG
jgi:hypothetical protein